MFAHTENGKVTFRGDLPKNWRNISSLDLSRNDLVFLKSVGWLPLTQVEIQLEKNEVIDGEDINIGNDLVTITPKKRSMTDEEIKTRDDQAMVALREERDGKLAASDWTQGRDITLSNDDAWKSYRTALRNLPANTSDPANPTWPEEPSQ